MGTGVALRGVTLRDSAPSFLEPHGLPTGGDWGLQHTGAITLRGTANFTMDGCLLARLDGNALFLGGWNRGATISNNEFAWIGATAMAAWGDTSQCLNENCTKSTPFKVGPDGRAGEQPTATRSLCEGQGCEGQGCEGQGSLWPLHPKRC